MVVFILESKECFQMIENIFFSSSPSYSSQILMISQKSRNGGQKCKNPQIAGLSTYRMLTLSSWVNSSMHTYNAFQVWKSFLFYLKILGHASGRRRCGAIGSTVRRKGGNRIAVPLFFFDFSVLFFFLLVMKNKPCLSTKHCLTQNSESLKQEFQHICIVESLEEKKQCLSEWQNYQLFLSLYSCDFSEFL